jgi:hypothetical protein
MCNLVYEISVGKMQHFPGNQECILPTDFWPTCHFAYKIGKFVHPAVICFRQIS